SSAMSLPSAAVRKILSPQTAGVELPWPGRGLFQTTFSLSDHFVARPVSELTPSLCGPRHCGQFSAAAAPVIDQAASIVRRERFTAGRPRVGWAESGAWF